MTPVSASVLLIATGLASYFDLTAKRIPNWISASLAIYGVMVHGWSGGWKGALLSLAGMAIGGAILFLPYLLRGMGAGDVKLLAAVGSVVGPKEIIPVFLLAGLAGGLLSLFALVSRERLADAANKMVQWLVVPRSVRAGADGVAVPYGVAISAGVWIFVCLRERLLEWIAL